jgi:hypothetical protein
MKAVSIKQPWASLICTPREDNPLLGIKDIENRTWRTHFRGRIYVHASAPKKFNIQLTDEQTKEGIPVLKTAFEGTMQFGAIIGEVDIIDCVIGHSSIWAEKEPDLTKKPIWNWVLANPVLYDKPILNVKGKLSFWYPDTDIVECIGCSQKFDSETMEEDDANEKYCPECWEHFEPILAQEAKEIRESEF